MFFTNQAHVFYQLILKNYLSFFKYVIEYDLIQ